MILQGAPGTGKTYSTALLAVGIIDEDDSLDYSDYNAVVKNMKLTKREVLSNLQPSINLLIMKISLKVLFQK